jgi:rhomboid protease GluP
MNDQQGKHPLHENPKRHPLTDAPEPRKQQKRRVLIPGEKIVLDRQIGLVDQPILTYALIVINALIFGLRFVSPELAVEWIVAGLNDPQAVVQDGEFYRLFTAMFLHLDETHMLFNGLALYWIGTHTERIYGYWRYALIYFVGGLGGSVISLVFDVGGLGASGAVFAVWGAEVVYLLRNRELYGKSADDRLRSSMMIMGLNFLMGFFLNTYNQATGSSNVRIGNLAHFGGLAGGAWLAYALTPMYRAGWIKNAEGDDAVQLTQVNPPERGMRMVGAYVALLVGLIALSFFLLRP